MLSPNQKLCCLISSLVLLVIPVSGLTATSNPDTNNAEIEILGSVLAQAEDFRIRGKTPDQLEQGLALYQHAAHHGVAVAQYWVGVMYFKGQGTESDIEKAKYWISLSAEQAYPPAKQFLSEFAQDEEEEDEPDC